MGIQKTTNLLRQVRGPLAQWNASEHAHDIYWATDADVVIACGKRYVCGGVREVNVVQSSIGTDVKLVLSDGSMKAAKLPEVGADTQQRRSGLLVKEDYDAFKGAVGSVADLYSKLQALAEKVTRLENALSSAGTYWYQA